MSSRETMLARVREALGDTEHDHTSAAADRPVRPASPDSTALVELFVERVEDYRASVSRCAATELAQYIGALLPPGARVVTPPGLELDLPGRVPDDALSATQLDGIDAVVTACRLGIAETGTIVLDHTPDQGRRALSLVPDLHVCIVRTDQLVWDVPDAVPLLDPARPQTWVSGPSATSDIELDRVEGVHGPRTLAVVLVS